MVKDIILKNFQQYLVDKGYTESSVSSYSFGLASFLEFQMMDNRDFENFDNQALLDFQSSLGGAAQTINVKLSAIKKYCEYLKASKNILVDHKFGFMKTVNKKRINLISDFVEILEYIKANQKNKLVCQRDSLIFEFLYYLGLRINELIEVRKSDINEGCLLYKDRKIVINNNLLNELDDYFKELGLKDSDYVFFSCASRKIDFTKHLTAKSIEDIFNKYTGFLGRDISISDLRHSYILKNQNQEEEIESIHKHRIVDCSRDYLNLFSKVHDGRKF